MTDRGKIINELQFQLNSKEVKDQHYPVQLSASDANAILALLKEPEWISVKDRLPEESGEYLVFCKIGYQAIINYSARHKAFNALDTEKKAVYAIEVTHWMPLPEPPEEGENG